MSDSPSFPVPAPLPQHAVFQKDVGTWDAECVFRMGGPEQRSTGVMTSRLIAGGKWLVSDFRNPDTGFEGHGVYGYDPTRGKYVGTWVDLVSPGVHALEGDWDPERKVMTMTAVSSGPDGKPMTMREVTEVVSPARQVFRAFVPTPAGEHEIMTITYSKR
jgi:hypothetical protein